MPIWLPSAMIRRTSSGWSTTSVPTTKKVACTWLWRSTSRIRGVQTGSGPSSKVSAMVRAFTRAVCAEVAAFAITGPPWATRLGTAALRPRAPVTSSDAIPNMWWV
jgi:hypothetical protein